MYGLRNLILPGVALEKSMGKVASPYTTNEEYIFDETPKRRFYSSAIVGL
jgi:hypothetical protein